MPSNEMKASMEAMRAFAAAAYNESTIEQRREVLDILVDVYPLPDDVVVTEVNAGGVPAIYLEPVGVRKDATLLYLHGGGYQSGSTKSHRELAARLAQAAGVRALAIDYRLAPEHPFPAAVDDAVAAYRWIVEEVGVTPDAIAVAGDSAGGGLVGALLVAARESALPLPGAAAMLSPWLDLTGSGGTMVTKSEADPLLSAEELDAMAADYVGKADRSSPLISPLFADLSGLPPLLVEVGTEEVLLDDGRRFAEAAGKAGVNVTLTVADGMPHVWHILAATPEATEGTERVGAFLAGHLA